MNSKHHKSDAFQVHELTFKMKLVYLYVQAKALLKVKDI